MLTGSVVGDGEYATLAELFAASGGALAFYGTLIHEHDCGESTLPVAYVLRAPEEPSAHGAEVIADARRALGWKEELVCCCAASYWSGSPLAPQEDPLVAALDVDATDRSRSRHIHCTAPHAPRASRAVRCARRLRLLLLRADAPDQHRLVCHLAPRADPPTLEGVSTAPDGGAHRLMAVLRCRLPTVPAPEPVRAEGAAESDGVTREACGEEGAVGEEGACDGAEGACDGAAEGPRFDGSVHHPMFGDVSATLSLVKQLAAEPEAAAARGGVVWPPAQPESEATDSGAGGGGAQTTWWRATWHVAEMSIDEIVYVGINETDLVVVHPTRGDARRCDVGTLDRPRGRPRIRGGDHEWTPAKPAGFTLVCQ